MTQLTGPNALSTAWKYDEFGRKVLEKRADGNGSTWAYRYCSNMVVNGVAGTDSCPTIAGVAGAYSVTATPVKAPIDLSAGTTGAANGPYGKTYYDPLGRIIRTETQGWDGSAIRLVYQDTEYNSLGRVVRSSEPYFAGASSIKWVLTSYDWIGRAYTVTQPNGGSATSSYQGLTISVTDALGHVTTQTRNADDRLVSITDPNGKVLSKSYDAYGNLLSTSDSAGNLTQISYDTRGRKFQMIDPDMGTWTYAYNALGELVKQTDAKGQVTQMSYDLLGRLTAKTQPSLNTNWYYDQYQNGTACTKGIGKLCEAKASNGYGRKHVYDSLGRASSTAVTVGATTYTSSVSYTSDGRTNTVTYPSGVLSLQNVYANSLGFLQKVVNAASPSSVHWTLTGADAEGHITGQTFGNNNAPNVSTSSSSVYDAKGLRQTVAGVGNALQNVSYDYDLSGSLTTRNDAITGVNASYTYDALNRIQTETRQGGGVTTAQTVTWVYDDLGIGNIKSRSDVGSYAYNAGGAGSVRPHAVASIAGTVNGQANPAYAYDANGNLSSVKIGAATLRSVTWNSYDKADSISQTVAGVTNKLDFLYDSEGDRVREVFSKNGTVQRTTVYLNGGGLFYEEETIGGVTSKKHYINAAGGTVGVLTYAGTAWTPHQYWLKDHLGSPMVIVGSNGAVIERLAYEPFGKRRNSNGTTDVNGTLTAASTRRGFTGHEHDDEVGLVNMNGRVFDEAIGRFLSADPTIQSPTYMQSYNRYAYAWNSPLNGTDPSGYGFWREVMRLNDQAVVFSIGVMGADPIGGYGMWKALNSKWGYEIKGIAVAVGCSFITWGWGAVACVGAGTAIVAKGYGASNSEALKAGAIAAATAYAMTEVGSATQGDKLADGTRAGMSNLQKVANVAGHAAVGCASASASGGSCRSGALAGGFSAAATNFGPTELVKTNIVVGVAYNAVVGGIGSELGGGKFANGAVTGSFGYLFNRWRHGEWVPDEDCSCHRVGNAIKNFVSDFFNAPSDIIDSVSNSETIARPDYPPQSGGRSGERVKDATGPPNSAIPTTGESVWITDGNGNVVVDVTPGRAKPVTPGVGFGDKRSPTPTELDLWDRVKQPKKP